MRKGIGTIELGDKVDITDPCYDKDVWCRINDYPVIPGRYTCYAEYASDNSDRVRACGIYLDKPQICSHRIGEIGVDAGLAGFFNNKKDFTDEEWSVFCRKLDDSEDSWIDYDGFFTSSGYGDGCYRVYSDEPLNEPATALKIVFL